MMDEGNSGTAVRKKWRKYIKRGADDFWDSHGIYLHRSGSYLSFLLCASSQVILYLPLLFPILIFMTLLLHPSLPFYPAFYIFSFTPFASFCVLDPLGSLSSLIFLLRSGLFFVIPSPIFLLYFIRLLC